MFAAAVVMGGATVYHIFVRVFDDRPAIFKPIPGEPIFLIVLENPLDVQLTISIPGLR